MLFGLLLDTPYCPVSWRQCLTRSQCKEQAFCIFYSASLFSLVCTLFIFFPSQVPFHWLLSHRASHRYCYLQVSRSLLTARISFFGALFFIYFYSGSPGSCVARSPGSFRRWTPGSTLNPVSNGELRSSSSQPAQHEPS